MFFFFENFECVTIGKTCVTNHMFLFSKLCSLSHRGSVTKAQKYVTKDKHCNT